MQFSLPKKWRTLCWAAPALMLADMMILSVGVLLGGGALLFLVCVLLLVAAAALAIVSSLNLRCPACGRALDRLALRLDECFFCPKCGAKIYME